MGILTKMHSFVVSDVVKAKSFSLIRIRLYIHPTVDPLDLVNAGVGSKELQRLLFDCIHAVEAGLVTPLTFDR